MSGDALVLVERRGHVAVVTLNRPSSRNAIDERLARALSAAIDEVGDDADVRAVVLAGAGRVFCTGHDLRALAAGEDPQAAHLGEGGYGGLVRRALDKPIIAAVQGAAFGGGLELALACDIIVAEEGARIGLPEVTVGLFAAAGGAMRLAQQVPARIAAWLVYSGEPMTVEEAAGWGLINEVVSHGTLLQRAVERAERIARNAPLAVQASKRMLRELDQQSSWAERPWSLMREELARLGATSDAQEGLNAFTERREPRWRAR